MDHGLPYEKQLMNFPVSYPPESFPSETLVDDEGGVSRISIPLYEKGGLIVVGPVKKIRKKEIKKLDEIGTLLAELFKEEVKNVGNNRGTCTDMLKNQRKVQMLTAKNYVLYYGYGQVEKLSCFDVIIVEPKGFTVPQFRELKTARKVLFTYLSLFEFHPTDPVFQQLDEEDFLYMDGRPFVNEVFGTYMVNLQSRKWMEHLLGKVKYQLEFLGADGLFLDTIGDIESHAIPLSVKRVQLDAIVNFLHVIKMLYPTHLLIQNNGLEMVCMQTAPYIDGICWENPPLSLPESKEWTDLIVQRLTLLKNKFQLKVFLLLEETTEKERKSYSLAKGLAQEKDFLLYNAPANYVSEIDENSENMFIKPPNGKG